jgi:hypothetical protein
MAQLHGTARCEVRPMLKRVSAEYLARAADARRRPLVATDPSSKEALFVVAKSWLRLSKCPSAILLNQLNRL